MKKLSRNIPFALVLALLLASCGTGETIQSSPFEEKSSAPTVFLSSTILPTITSTATPFFTPFPATSEQAIVEAFDSLCLGAKEILDSEASPNGEWIAATCYWENGKEESPLQVVNTDHTKEWKIYFSDFVKGEIEYGRKNIIVPYRWSRDGEFLYAVSPTIASGCCWIGGQYVLLIRLNLETGLQEELINTIDPGATLSVSFAISENDRYLLFTPVTEQPYDFAVLDLFSGESRVVTLEEQEPIDLEFAAMSPYDDIIVLPLFKNIEYNNYVVESLVVVDLKSDEQRVLVSDLKDGEELYPIRWVDRENILVSSANPSLWYEKQSAKYWSIDINTGERESVENP